LHFPSEYSDTLAGKNENETLKEKLFKKYLSRPPSKRVNFLKHGIFSPFSGPFQSILKLHSTDIHDTNFYILRNRQLLNKISSLISNRSKQQDANSLSESELELLEKSFINVRLLGEGKGNMESFSLIYCYSSKKEFKNSENAKTLIGKIINDFRQEEVKAIHGEIQQGKKNITLNRLLKSRYNKHNLLVRESSFEKYETEIQSQKESQKPIGFIYKSSFTLSNGKISGNGYILAKCLIKMTNSNLILYNSPSSHNKLKTAKITNIFFK